MNFNNGNVNWNNRSNNNDPARNYIFKGNPALRTLIPKEKSLFYAGGKGLPIGNLTSQFFANIYLNELDKFICSSQKYYLRYVDDFILLGDKELIRKVPKIKQFLKDKLDLEISDKKTRFQQITKGIDFLGYYIKPNYILVRRKVVSRFKNKMSRLPEVGSKELLFTVNSYFGHFRHASSFILRKHIYEKYLKQKFTVKGNYKSIKTKI